MIRISHWPANLESYLLVGEVGPRLVLPGPEQGVTAEVDLQKSQVVLDATYLVLVTSQVALVKHAEVTLLMVQLGGGGGWRNYRCS